MIAKALPATGPYGPVVFVLVEQTVSADCIKFHALSETTSTYLGARYSAQICAGMPRKWRRKLKIGT